MKKLLPLLFTVPLLMATKPASAFTSSITLNQPNPTFGDTVDFTSVYPKEAHGQGRNPQYPAQPNVQVSCYQGSTLVAQENATTADETRIGNGWYQGLSAQIILSQAHGLIWDGGPADCSVTLYSVSEKQGVPIFSYWAQTFFHVNGV